MDSETGFVSKCAVCCNLLDLVAVKAVVAFRFIDTRE